MKLSLSEVFVSNIIVTMVISNKSCCKHVLFTNLSDFISTTTRVTSLKSKKFLFCSFSVAKFGIAPNLSPTDQCFQHEKGVSLESRYEGTKIFTPCPQKIGFWAQKRPNLAQNWHFGPNIGIFGPFDLMPDQKTMRTSCRSGFLLCWYQNFYLLP